LKFLQKLKIIFSTAFQTPLLTGDPLMNALTGMEKFSHLEDKIYLTIEFARKLRDEKDEIEREAVELRQNASRMEAENREMQDKIAVLLSERDSIQTKVEAMLEAISTIDADVAAAVGR
jgi:uncharacterized coiled-coil DUF342 family protein